MLSVTTPLHDKSTPFVTEAYRSLTIQSILNWEWLVLENHGGKLPTEILADERVRVIKSDDSTIGALKRRLNLEARSDRIVELDADDILAPNALESVASEFDRGADFVYSDFAEFKNGSWEPNVYGEAFGWQHYEVKHEDHSLRAMRAPPPTAHNLRRVEWAPNHIRAWTKKAYLDVGGHDSALAVADDHDLCARFYIGGKTMRHLPECLYFYRVHEHNTVAEKNFAIQVATNEVYNQRVWKLAETWVRAEKLMLVDLCGGIDTVPGYVALDKVAPNGGIECDLEKRWPLEDNSVGLIRAFDAVEHLRDPVHTMNEAWRVLAPGGWLMIDVPSTNGLGAFCDPTHVSFWNRLSFRYYTDPLFARYIPAFKGRFQTSRVIEHYPSEWHLQNNVPYVEAHLLALKGGYTPMGEVLWGRP